MDWSPANCKNFQNNFYVKNLYELLKNCLSFIEEQLDKTENNSVQYHEKL